MGRFNLPYTRELTSTARVGAGYKLHFYESGTSTPLDTYSNAALSTPNANPVVADSQGRFGSIFLENEAYKVTLSTDADVLVWTADPVQDALGELGIPVVISKGGTGATTATQARTNLGLGTAATYDYDDIVSELSVPPGVIMLWYSSTGTIPSGWGLCDGTVYQKADLSGTITSPDLRGKFIIGAGGAYSVGATGGAASVTTSSDGAISTNTGAAGSHNHTGSTDAHTLTTAQIPSHRHDFTVNVNTPGAGNYMVNSAGGASIVTIADDPVQLTGGGGSHTHGIQSQADHTHSVTAAAHTHTAATMPPYAAFAWIMKL